MKATRMALTRHDRWYHDHCWSLDIYWPFRGDKDYAFYLDRLMILAEGQLA